MDLAFSDEDKAFQREVRDWIAENYDDDLRKMMSQSKNGYLNKTGQVKWQKKLASKGWATVNWPVEFGGPDFTPSQAYIYNMEMSLAGVPTASPMGLKMVAPVIMAFGTDEQKAQHLPPIINSDIWWCQGYSEPGSGSDLASLQMKAERDGDDYILNGSKIWTTHAQWADWMFCLVRTDNSGKPQNGISFLLLRMDTPGILVKALPTLDGPADNEQEINQVFFDNVRVPVANRIGEEGKGWTYAKYLLEFERGGQAFGPRLRKAFRHLQTLSKTQMTEGEPLSANPNWREKMAAVEMEIDAVEMNELMFYSSLKTGDAPGNMGSVVKMRGTEVGQKVTELAVEAVGWYGTPFTELRNYDSNIVPVGGEYVDDVSPRYFNTRKTTIYGGSSEVQRNVLAKAMLGL
jgi:alkylation response protein AidB-like acyl-CoA dehydrogenase